MLHGLFSSKHPARRPQRYCGRAISFTANTPAKAHGKAPHKSGALRGVTQPTVQNNFALRTYSTRCPADFIPGALC